MGQRCVSVLLDRVREVTRLEQQTEKLNALGKLAGNLAHEMNNPASAAQRAASGLLDELRVYGHQKFRLGAFCLDEQRLLRCETGRKIFASRPARQHRYLRSMRRSKTACKSGSRVIASKRHGRLRPNSPSWV